MDKCLERIRTYGLVPAIKIDDAEKALELGKALEDGGVPVAEVTFRTPAAADCIRALKDSAPGIVLGAGTVTNVERAKQAIAAGASYIVTPGMNPSVIDYCLERGVPIIPGINGPAGIERALEKGLDVLKFFPAELSGGIPMIDALSGPFPEATFLPTGGIDLQNMEPYARHPKVFAIGGTWMAKPAWIEEGRWDAIRQACADSVRALHGFAIHHLGVNFGSRDEAAGPLAFLTALGFPVKEGTGSIFAGPFELMKSIGRGEKGHIALKANNVDRAVAFFSRMGIGVIEETVSRDAAGIKVAYLDKDLGGFAVHLVRG